MRRRRSRDLRASKGRRKALDDNFRYGELSSLCQMRKLLPQSFDKCSCATFATHAQLWKQPPISPKIADCLVDPPVASEDVAVRGPSKVHDVMRSRSVSSAKGSGVGILGCCLLRESPEGAIH